ELADDACSLRPYVDRLCVTVEMPPGDGEPLFYRSVIRSNSRLSYGQAERREAEPELLEQLALNDALAPELRRRRFAPGALAAQTAAGLAGEISRRVVEYSAQSGRGREAFQALVLRALKQARYDPTNLGHSGLASVAYCHFTSPIRRYPDLVVHRTLLRELGAADDPLPEDLPDLAAHVSARERAAAAAEYAADAICLAWLLEATLCERGWEEPFGGEIIGLIGGGLFVRFGDVFEGFLPARRLPGDYFELDPTATRMQ